MLNEKFTIVLFNSWIDKGVVSESEYFSEPRSLGGRVKVELDLSNYAANRF